MSWPQLPSYAGQFQRSEHMEVEGREIPFKLYVHLPLLAKISWYKPDNVSQKKPLVASLHSFPWLAVDMTAPWNFMAQQYMFWISFPYDGVWFMVMFFKVLSWLRTWDCSFIKIRNHVHTCHIFGFFFLPQKGLIFQVFQFCLEASQSWLIQINK